MTRRHHRYTLFLSALLLAATAFGAPDPGLAAEKAKGAADETAEAGRLRLVISRSEQRIDVYRGLKLVTSSRVSTGKPGHATPVGVYSILDKRKWHRSNIYSGASMPFMQRITWSGIALHAGHVPNYPASHGCIRLPEPFAKKLFGMTEVGADVILTSEPARLTPIHDARLFQPVAPDAVVSSHEEPGDADAVPPHIALADFEYLVDRMAHYQNRSTKPLRILITRRTGRQRMMDIQSMLKELGHDPGEIDGYLGGNTGGAIQSFQRATGAAPTGMVTDELVAALHKAVGRPDIKGHLYVRQNRKPLFDAPVQIRDVEAPLGTHVFSIADFKPGETNVSWMALTVAGSHISSPREALDRIDIPEDLRTRISDLLMPGSSLVITDDGIGRETGRGTDFIVQPKLQTLAQN